jgi:hypothetical protein
MTSGRSPYADDPDTPHYGPGASPAYGPPTYGPPATPPSYGPPPTPTHGFPATPTYGAPAYGPGASYGTWPPAPELGPITPNGWSPAPIEPAAPAARSRRRGQWLSWTVLVLAVVVAAVLGICTYVGLATVRITASDPWGTAWTWLTVCGAAALAAVVVFLLGVVALLVSRPKLVAAMATLVALVLPFVALKFGLSFGIAAVTRHAGMDGAALVDLLTAGLDQLGSVAGGPVRDVLEWVIRLAASQA